MLDFKHLNSANTDYWTFTKNDASIILYKLDSQKEAENMFF